MDIDDDITKNSNREYGLKIAALFSIRCVSQGNYDEKFWITFNVDGVVPFGNIILYQGNMMYILRIKYEDDPKDIKEKEFLAPTGDLSLIESFHDNVKLKSEISRSNEIKFLIFTNTKVIRDENTILKEIEGEDFLRLKCVRQKIFKIENSDISENVYLANEISMENINLEIYKEIRNLLFNNNYQIDVDYIVKNFLRFLEGSFQNNKIVKTEDIISKLIELLLSTFQVNNSVKNKETCDDCERRNIWEKVVKDKSLIIVEDHDEEIMKFLLNCVHKQFLLEVANYEDFLFIQHILSLANYSFKAIILLPPELTINKDGSSSSHKILQTLNDLNKDIKEEILKLPVTFQGRLSLLLGDLVNESMFEFIKCSDIIKILLGTFNVGNELKILTGNLIKRSTSKIFIKMDVLNEVKDEFFLIEDCKSCFNVPQKGVNVYVSKDRINFEEESKKQHNQFFSVIHHLNIFNDKYLEWKDSIGPTEKIKKFQINLQGETNDILDHLSKRVVLINGKPGMGKSTIMDYVANEANINKLMLKINLNEHQNYFKSIKNLNKNAVEHVRYFINMHKYINVKLTKAIYENYIAKRGLILLLDGFDEISVCYKEEVTKLAKCIYEDGFFIWITTRPVMKFYLEEKFNTICMDLHPFTQENKKEYLFNYYSNYKELLDKNVDELLNFSMKHLNDDLTGIPLYMKLLAEAFLDNCVRFIENRGLINVDNFNLFYLYEHFIENEFKILREKFNNDYTIKMKEHQSLFALKLLFPLHDHLIDIDKELDYYRNDHYKIQFLQREGMITINENLEINFIHRTFAEYLAAEWLSKNILNEKAKILINERFNEDYKFLFYIFDMFLSKEYPLHAALINKNFEEAKKLLNNSHFIDKGGRSLLHIICLYSIQYPLMFHEYANFFASSESIDFLNSKLYQEDGMLNIIEQILDYKILDIKKDILGYNPLDYALANNSLAAAEKIYEKLKPSTINVNIKLNLKKSYLGYCALLNYKSLFNFLLPYFASRDFLLKNIDVNINVNAYFKSMYSSNVYTKSILNYKIDFETMTILNLLQSKSAYSGYINGRYTDLRYAIIFDSKDNVEKLLREGADIDKWDHDNNTPLHYAILHGCLENAKLLLSKGANVNKRNYADDTALHLALRENHIEIARMLLVNGATGNVANKRGETPLHYAIEKNYLDVFEKIFNKDGINDNQNVSGNTPLHLAIKNGQLNIAEILILNGSDGNLGNKLGETPLHFAIENGYIDGARKIISNGFVNSKRNIFGSTPLHLALIKRELELANLLIANGANINIENDDNEIALHLAAQNGYLDILQIIISNSNINKRNRDGNTPLHLALMNKSIATAEMLIQNTTAVSLENKTKNTPLHYAARSENKDLVNKLLTKDSSNTNKRNCTGNTPLHPATLNNQADTAELIILQSINTLNNHSETPLHCVQDLSNQNILDVFVFHGADVNIKSKVDDNTVLHLLIKNDLIDIAEKFLSKGYVTDQQDGDKNTPLHLALKKKYSKIAELLVLNGANVHITNSLKETALHCAAENDCYNIIDCILSRDNIIDKQNYRGETALYLALMKGNIGIVEKLLSKGANVTLSDDYDNTPLSYALINRDETIVNKMLLNINSDSNINDWTKDDGNSYLHLALSKRYLKALEVFINFGPDINRKNKIGETTLHLAIKNDCLDVLPKLISKENINAKIRKSGNTPLHMALVRNNSDLIDLLLQNEADVNVGNKNGQSVLHCAVKKSHLGVLNKFLSINSLEVDRQDKKGNTALHLASAKGYIEIVNALLCKGGNAALKNRKGLTALDLAVIGQHEQVVLCARSYSKIND